MDYNIRDIIEDLGLDLISELPINFEFMIIDHVKFCNRNTKNGVSFHKIKCVTDFIYDWLDSHCKKMPVIDKNTNELFYDILHERITEWYYDIFADKLINHLDNELADYLNKKLILSFN